MVVVAIDVWLDVFRFLSRRQLCRMELCCRRMRALISPPISKNQSIINKINNRSIHAVAPFHWPRPTLLICHSGQQPMPFTFALFTYEVWRTKRVPRKILVVFGSGIYRKLNTLEKYFSFTAFDRWGNHRVKI